MTWKRLIYKGQETIYEISHRGNIYNTETEKMVRMSKNGNGYWTVGLKLPDGEYRSFLAHRLVAKAFIPNDIPERNQVNHIDGNKENNRVSNLEWVTDQENKRHAFKNGLYSIGEDHGRAVNTDKDIHEVCRLLTEGYTPKEIAKMTPVKLSMIKHIKDGDNWTHISCNYDFKRTEPRFMYKEYYELIDNVILNYGITKPKEVRKFVAEETADIDDKTFANLVGNRLRKIRNNKL